MSTPAMDTELQAMRRALESLAARFSPDTAPIEPTDIDAASAFVWRPEQHRLEPVPTVARVDLSLLRGGERARKTRRENVRMGVYDINEAHVKSRTFFLSGHNGRLKAESRKSDYRPYGPIF